MRTLLVSLSTVNRIVILCSLEIYKMGLVTDFSLSFYVPLIQASIDYIFNTQIRTNMENFVFEIVPRRGDEPETSSSANIAYRWVIEFVNKCTLIANHKSQSLVQAEIVNPDINSLFQFQNFRSRLDYTLNVRLVFEFTS